MSTFAPINQTYFVDQDSSSPFTSPVINHMKPTSSICYQMKWVDGVIGKFVWEASIFSNPHVWEQLVSCDEVVLDTAEQSPALNSIVSIPSIWLSVGFMRFRWVPTAGSTGNIDVAIRIVPI